VKDNDDEVGISNIRIKLYIYIYACTRIIHWRIKLILVVYIIPIY